MQFLSGDARCQVDLSWKKREWYEADAAQAGFRLFSVYGQVSTSLTGGQRFKIAFTRHVVCRRLLGLSTVCRTFYLIGSFISQRDLQH